MTLMTKKYFSFCMALLLLTFINCQQQQNPKNICKKCGNFDLAKITFKENINDLTAKTEIWKTVLVNSKYSEKDSEKLLKNDSVKLIKYHFENQHNEILGNNPFNYEDEIVFNHLIILTNPKNKIYAYEATNFYDGNYADIGSFIDYLKKENKNAAFSKNNMLGNLEVYQWKTDEKLIQFVVDKDEGIEERTINGNKKTLKSTYIKLNVYNDIFINNSIEKFLIYDINFSVFNNNNFSK